MSVISNGVQNGSAGIASYTLTLMPSAGAVAAGTVINIPQSEFGAWATLYMPAWGIYLQSDGVSKWMPADGKQVFAYAYGTEAAPVVTDQQVGTINTWTPFALSSLPYIPGKLLYSGLRIRAEVIAGKVLSSVAWQLGVQLGTSALTNANTNKLIALCGAQTTQTDRQCKLDSYGIVTSSTGFTADVGPNDTGANLYASLIANASSGVNTTNDADNTSDSLKDKTGLSSVVGDKNYLTPSFYSTVAAGTDTHALYSFRFTLEI